MGNDFAEPSNLMIRMAVLEVGHQDMKGQISAVKDQVTDVRTHIDKVASDIRDNNRATYANFFAILTVLATVAAAWISRGH